MVLTTSIAGMGFDPNNVTKVIHTCPPRDLSQCFQEIGRAGRRGQPAQAILYYNNRDIARNYLGIKDDIIEYCKNNSNCLRNQLLSVFGLPKKTKVLIMIVNDVFIAKYNANVCFVALKVIHLNCFALVKWNPLFSQNLTR